MAFKSARAAQLDRVVGLDGPVRSVAGLIALSWRGLSPESCAAPLNSMIKLAPPPRPLPPPPPLAVVPAVAALVPSPPARVQLANVGPVYAFLPPYTVLYAAVPSLSPRGFLDLGWMPPMNSGVEALAAQALVQSLARVALQDSLDLRRHKVVDG